MAKATVSLSGDYRSILEKIESAILDKSFSASYEDGVMYNYDDYITVLRVYERYSFTGSNRVSMSVLLHGKDERFSVTLITSGGSQATFFKINTLGEDSFLESVLSELESVM